MSFTLIAVGLALVLGIAIVLRQRHRPYNAPPVKAGWIPFMGVAVDFGKAPLLYMNQVRKELGSTFTLYIAGRRMTFVFDPKDIEAVFVNPTVSFQKAVQPFTERAAGISTACFNKYHKDIHDAMKGELAPNKLAPYTSSMYYKFAEHLDKVGMPRSGAIDLVEFCRDIMFKGGVTSLFGEETVKGREQELYKHFYAYDKDFEYGTQLPEFLLPTWAASKHWLLKVFHKVASTISLAPDLSAIPDSMELMRSVARLSDDSSRPNYLLLLLWASQANAVPASSWCLAFMLATPRYWSLAKKELHDVAPSRQPGTPITGEMVNELKFMKRCVLESIRLRSPGMIPRITTTPLELGGFTIPAGDFVMMSPYWTHRHEKSFPEPESFIPDRWSDADLDKGKFLEHFIGFGGGRFQCPGRWLALNEMILFIAMVVDRYDMTLMNEVVPQPSPLHLVGVQEPLASMQVNFTRLVQ